MTTLDRSTVLITGGASGIGRQMAQAFAAAGSTVVIWDLNLEGAQQVAKDLAATSGTEHHAYRVDVTDKDLVRQTADAVRAEVGDVDVLVNNAGIIDREDSVDVTTAAWQKVVDINLTGLFFLSQHLGRPMVERGHGKIVSIASLLAFQGGIRVASYAASKHGVAGITKALANEWGPAGVQVNAIAPGYMATDNTTALREDPERSKAILDRIPAGRWGTPQDIAGAAVFLSSSAADYVNGHVLVVDGGWMAR